MSYVVVRDFFGRERVCRSNGGRCTDMDRVQLIMEGDERARNCDNVAVISYWLTHDLDIIQEFVEPHRHEAMIKAASRLTPAKTIINRAQDCRRKHDHLAPSPDVAERRGAGR